MNDKQHVITESMLDKIRNIRDYNNVNGERYILNEEGVYKTDTEVEDSQIADGAENNKDTDSIAITNSPRFGQNVLQSQEDAFRNEVDGGAQFADENENDPNTNPLVYIPANKDKNRADDLIFSGTIPGKNNMKFQFRLKDNDGDGCFVWVEGLRLTDENIKMLNKLRGFYLNWRDQWQKEGKLLSTIGKQGNK